MRVCYLKSISRISPASARFYSHWEHAEKLGQVMRSAPSPPYPQQLPLSHHMRTIPPWHWKTLTWITTHFPGTMTAEVVTAPRLPVLAQARCSVSSIRKSSRKEPTLPVRQHCSNNQHSHRGKCRPDVKHLLLDWKGFSLSAVNTPETSLRTNSGLIRQPQSPYVPPSSACGTSPEVPV